MHNATLRNHLKLFFFAICHFNAVCVVLYTESCHSVSKVCVRKVGLGILRYQMSTNL